MKGQIKFFPVLFQVFYIQADKDLNGNPQIDKITDQEYILQVKTFTELLDNGYVMHFILQGELFLNLYFFRIN